MGKETKKKREGARERFAAAMQRARVTDAGEVVEQQEILEQAVENSRKLKSLGVQKKKKANNTGTVEKGDFFFGFFSISLCLIPNAIH